MRRQRKRSAGFQQHATTIDVRLFLSQTDFVPTDIKRITKTGIETVDGKYQDLDVIICATGKPILADLYK